MNLANPIPGAIAALALGLLVTALASAADPVTLELLVGDRACENVIVQTPLPAALADHELFALTQIETGERVAVQLDRSGSKPTLVWIVRGKLDAGSRLAYSLQAVKEPAQPNRVTVLDDGKRLAVTVDAKPVLNYNHATVPAPDAKLPYYAKSGYLHPLYNPSGQIVTDDFNPHHTHQHGVMFAWRKMTFEGRSTNGWEQQAELGKVEHARVDDFGSGPVFGFFKVRLHHVDLTAPDGPATMLDEIWNVRVYAFDDAFRFDLTSTQSCASDKPVTVDAMHYGGMTIRGNADWLQHGSFDYLTSQGRSKTDGNQTRPDWVDLSGPIAGQTSGTLIMDHPSNFRFPQPVRLHPTLPYFCFVPASLGSFEIQPGTPFVSRYRFYVHDGAIDVDLGNRLWQQYSHPPQIRVTATKK